MSRAHGSDRAAGAVEAAALALVAGWVTYLVIHEEEDLDETPTLGNTHESRVLQREAMPNVLFVLHAMSLAAVLWALITPHQLPRAVQGLSRHERDTGIVVGCILPPLVLLSRLLVERYSGREDSSFTFFYAWTSVSVGASVLIKVGLCRSLAPSVVLLVDAIVLPVASAIGQIECGYRWILASGCRCVVGLVLFYTMKCLPRSFTVGESVLVAQGVGMGLFDALLTTLVRLDEMDVIDLAPGIMHPWMLFETERKDYVIALQAGLLGSLMVCLAVVPLLNVYGSPAPSAIAPPLPIQASISFVARALIVVGGFVYPWSCLLLDTWNPFQWLLAFIFDHQQYRFGLILYWLACLVVLVPLFAVVSRHFKLRTIIARKLFHALVVIMFVPAYFVDPPMLALSYGVALSVFALVECVRALSLPPFGRTIAEFMKAFIDHREGGRVILTHTYLLLGCALPLWLAPIISGFGAAPLASNAGILALGVGDAMGAVIGSSFGRRKLFGSKTIEGTLAILVSMGIASLLFHDFHVLALGNGEWTQASLFAIGLVLTALLEAATAQIDNLVLPLFLFVVSNLATCHRA